ncbi:hypothetical protein CR513_44405, partial [Mucuna pruriens]
ADTSGKVMVPNTPNQKTFSILPIKKEKQRSPEGIEAEDHKPTVLNQKKDTEDSAVISKSKTDPGYQRSFAITTSLTNFQNTGHNYNLTSRSRKLLGGTGKRKRDMARNHEDRRNYGEDPLEGTLQEYFILAIDVTNNIYCPPVGTRSFVLKPTLISMMQNAEGLPIEEPTTHLKKFLCFASMVSVNDIFIDTICLKFFPFSLADRALDKNPNAKLGEKFHGMLHRCPHHSFPRGQFIHIFNGGLSTLSQTRIEATYGGTIRKKPPIEAYATIKDMTSKNNYSSNDRHVTQRSVEMYQVDIGGTMERKLMPLPYKLNNMGPQSMQKKIVKWIAYSPSAGGSSTLTFLGKDNTKTKLRTYIDLHPCNIRTRDKGKKKEGQAYKI